MEEEPKHPQQELVRRIFYLKTLYNLSQEIGYLRDTDEIIKNLLLMVMGTFGASRWFILICDRTRRKVNAWAQRGFAQGTFDQLLQLDFRVSLLRENRRLL